MENTAITCVNAASPYDYIQATRGLAETERSSRGGGRSRQSRSLDDQQTHFVGLQTHVHFTDNSIHRLSWTTGAALTFMVLMRSRRIIKTKKHGASHEMRCRLFGEGRSARKSDISCHVAEKADIGPEIGK